jgi:hypothetical protein
MRASNGTSNLGGMDRDEAVRHARMEMAKRESEIIRTKPLHLPDNSSTPTETEHEDDERI